VGRCAPAACHGKELALFSLTFFLLLAPYVDCNLLRCFNIECNEVTLGVASVVSGAFIRGENTGGVQEIVRLFLILVTTK
jgi:hypothetical protein